MSLGRFEWFLSLLIGVGFCFYGVKFDLFSMIGVCFGMFVIYLAGGTQPSLRKSKAVLKK